MALAAGVRLSVIVALTGKRMRLVQQEIFIVGALRWPIPTRCYVIGGVKKMKIIFFWIGYNLFLFNILLVFILILFVCYSIYFE